MTVLRILVVEDDANIGMLLAEMLAGMGHEVCAVEATEAGAVGAAIRLKPDFMIVDVSLGDESGVSAVDQILRNRMVPHVFMSATRVRVPSADSIVLQKPFKESELVQAMERVLGRATAL